jgi:hypothetical protein
VDSVCDVVKQAGVMGLGTEGNDKSFQLKVEDDCEGIMSFRALKEWIETGWQVFKHNSPLVFERI